MIRCVIRTATSARAIALALLLWGGSLPLVAPPSHAQTAPVPFVRPPKPTELAPKIYEQMPTLPRANTYRSIATGDARPNDTFVSRLIQYHIQIKGRRLGSRMDWKVTFADLLGVSGPIFPEQYVGYEIITPNPTADDLKIVDSLSRAQRLQLVDLLAALQPPPPETPAPKPAAATPAQSDSSIPIPAVQPPQPVPTPAPVRGQGAKLLQF